jgi:hypothetical protein
MRVGRRAADGRHVAPDPRRLPRPARGGRGPHADLPRPVPQRARVPRAAVGSREGARDGRVRARAALPRAPPGGVPRQPAPRLRASARRQAQDREGQLPRARNPRERQLELGAPLAPHGERHCRALARRAGGRAHDAPPPARRRLRRRGGPPLGRGEAPLQPLGPEALRDMGDAARRHGGPPVVARPRGRRLLRRLLRPRREDRLWLHGVLPVRTLLARGHAGVPPLPDARRRLSGEAALLRPGPRRPRDRAHERPGALQPVGLHGRQSRVHAGS